MASSASLSSARHVLLTGLPGIGKTTLIKKTCEELEKQGYVLHGFITEEVRHFGRRKGFDVVSIDGQLRAPLARIDGHGHDSEAGPLNRPDPYRLGQYVVQVESFEQTALPLLHASNTGITVIDEIGKMESISRAFQQAVRSRMDDPRSVVLGTIPVKKGKPVHLLEQIYERKDVRIITVTKKNRDYLMEEIITAVLEATAEHIP